MFKLRIHTLGCKVNQYDSALLENILYKNDNFKAASKDENPDVLIVNTCAVTRSAGAQARQEIRKLKKRYPDAKLFAFGCYVRTGREEIENMDEIDELIVSKEPAEIGFSIKKSLKVDSRNSDDIYLKKFPSHTRAFLKVQDGCASFCSYCIVPFARGKPKSMPPEKVLKQIEILYDSGYREIVLSGVHLGMYGKDGGETDLLKLLKTIEKNSPINRIRLSSIEPDELSNDLIDFIAKSQKIVNHLHLPLQSADKKILKLMNRKYTPEFFKGRIEKISATVKECAIGLDVIAGFPHEGDPEFLNTLNMIKDIPVSYLHVFPFSLRNGTKAQTLKETVNSKTIKQRCSLLRQLGQEKKIKFRKSLIGTTQSVLIEEKTSKNIFSKGLSGNYVPVLVDSLKGCLKPNSEVDVKINRLDGEILFGKEEKERQTHKGTGREA